MAKKENVWRHVWCNCTCWCRLWRWLLNTSSATFLGIFVLALSLNVIARLCPSTYRWLTAWANQPNLPPIQSCRFDPINSDTLTVLSQTKTLKRFRVAFSLEHSGDLVRTIFLYSENPSISLYPEGTNAIPRMKDPPFLVVRNADLKGNKFAVEAIVDTENMRVSEADYSGRDCPVNVIFVNGGKNP